MVDIISWFSRFQEFWVESSLLIFQLIYMCGIFAYKWKQDAHTFLIHGLQRLEYRGYDSAGICVYDDTKKSLHTIKSVGKVSQLSNKVKNNTPQGSIWIAHTRRATHGGVTEKNAHPHMSNNSKRSLVHNGIIENYHKLKKDLIADGYTFTSETDTEVIVNLLEKHDTWNFLSTIQHVMTLIRGAFALMIMNSDHPTELVAIRRWSPLMFWYNDAGEYFFSSDTQAMSWYVTKMISLEEWDLLHIQWDEYEILADGIPTSRSIEDYDQEALEASKWSFKHFMLKEIYEQSAILRRICKWRVKFDDHYLHNDAFHGMHNEEYKKIVLVACGTSYHAARLWSYRLQQISGIQAEAKIASELENLPLWVDDKTLYIFVSQSGETADSLEVLKMVKEQWGHTFGIVNVVWSSIARLTDNGMFTRAGAEIWVASTKAFTAQIMCMMLISLYLGKRRGMRNALYQRILRELEQIPAYIEAIVDQTDYIRSIAQQISGYRDFFFLGRGVQTPIAYESSLKFKEITYLHSEWYPAWELKHGPLALIDENVPVIFNIPIDELFEQNLSSLQEVKARKWKILAISDADIPDADRQITIPKTIDELYPFLTAVAGQLLSYHVADILHKDIDKPRNLAKSVTVK